jgi:hypothetical protein
MVNDKYLAELGPIPRLIVDEKPPIGHKIWLITKYGNGYAGTYDKTDPTIYAWCPLPKLTPEQKRRLMAMDAADMPVEVAPADPENPPGCIPYAHRQENS